MKSTSLIWLTSLLGIFPLMSEANRYSHYPELASNSVTSENFELRSLLCKVCGEVKDVIYLPERNSYFASTDTGDVWQISAQGQLIDVLRGHGQLPDSGVYFKENHYIGWMYTGDDAPKTYKQIIEADALTQNEFDALLATTEQKAFHLGYEPNQYRYYLRQGNDWLAVNRIHEHRPGQPVMAPPKGVVYSYPQSRDNTTTLPFVRSFPLQHFANYEWRNPENPLTLQHFRRQGSERRRLLDFNSTGWNGPYGRGYFELRHEGEKLNFSAFHRVLDGRRDTPDLAYYQPHNTIPPEARIGFLIADGPRKHYVEQEPGFYVIRRRAKSTNDSLTGRAEQLHKKFWWQPGIEGMAPEKGQLRHLLFINGSDEDLNSSFARPMAAAFRPIPLEWDFYHSLPTIESLADYYLLFNGTFYSPRDLSLNFYSLLQLDEDETLAAFTQLAKQGASEQNPMALVLGSEWLKNGLVYQLELRLGESRIPLRKAKLATHPTSEYQARDFLPLYEDDRLMKAFDAALQDPEADAQFMQTSGALLAASPRKQAHAFAMASTSVKLIIARLQAKQSEAAEALFYHYVNNLYPHAGYDPKTLDIASMAFVIGLHYQRPEVIETAFSELLGGQALDISQLNNDILVYNLACYYAVNRQKTQLLQAARQAIQLGKKADQFLADTDFEFYWQDEEFLAAITAQR